MFLCVFCGFELACDDLELTGEDFFTIPDMALRDSALFAWRCSFKNDTTNDIPCVNEATQIQVFGSREGMSRHVGECATLDTPSSYSAY